MRLRLAALPPFLLRLYRLSLYLASLLLLVAVAFLAGYVFRWRQAAAFNLLQQAHQYLTRYGLKDTPAGAELEYGMIRGMLQAYDDPYTYFLDPPRNELRMQRLEGKFGGIGVQMAQDSQGHWVLFPFGESPARRAGMQDGDRLLKIDDLEVTAQLSSEIIQAAIRGPVEQKVRLTLGRKPDYTPFELQIERQEIELPSVTWRLDIAEPRLGIVQVNRVAASTPGEIQRAVSDLQRQGASGFALDLRDNPGGLLTGAVDSARLFLKDGVLIQEQARGQEVKTYQVDKPGPLADLPLVVLINNNSASASEMIAAILQGRQRAQLIGQPSFGKNAIQTIFTLSDHSSVNITTAQWWVPGLDYPKSGQGLLPDVPVDPAAAQPGEDPFLQAALRLLFVTP